MGHYWKKPLAGTTVVFKKGKIITKCMSSRNFSSMREQVWFFRRNFSRFVLFFKVGKHVELYGRDALILKRQANLKLLERHRGLRHSVGFPPRMVKGMRRNLLLKGYKTVLLAESTAEGRIKRRYAAELAFMFPPHHRHLFVRMKPHLQKRAVGVMRVPHCAVEAAPAIDSAGQVVQIEKGYDE